MSLSSWLSWTLSRSQTRRAKRRNPVSRPKTARLFLEQLEERALPSSYSAGSVSALIADINAANTAGGANTITLTAPTTSPYVLTSVNNTTNGATGLPVIAANDNLTMLGKGEIIERSTAAGTPDFRLLEVATGGSLTLGNLTLQGGLAECVGLGSEVSDGGGAIYNQGGLVLNDVTVQDNTAVGPSQGDYGFSGAGGGIYAVAGSVTLEGGTILQNNEALGGGAPDGITLAAGNAYGGGLFARGGTVTVTNAALDDNAAVAGQGARGGIDSRSSENGSAYGGGLYASGRSVSLTNATLDGNVARIANVVSFAGYGGGAYGGGLCLATGTASLTNCTVQGNSAQSYDGVSEGGGLFISSTATLTNCTVQGNSAPDYYGEGGGLYIVSGATVYLDSFTVANTINNTANYDPNIDGTYILQNP